MNAISVRPSAIGLGLFVWFRANSVTHSPACVSRTYFVRDVAWTT